MLRATDIEVRYGAAQAVAGASVQVPSNQLIAMIGRNGAGKTTLLLAISGLLRITRGQIRFDDDDLSGLTPHDIVKKGVAHVPQGRFLFETMTVDDNLELGARAVGLRGVELRQRLAYVREIFPILDEKRHDKARSLSGGQQQMAAIARALMSVPRVLLLDEPSTGLAPAVVDNLVETIVSLTREGLSILLVEQDAGLALDVADHVYIMANGRTVYDGAAEDLKGTDLLRSAYLGEQMPTSSTTST